MIYFLSFVDPDRPEGSRFLGAALVEADGLKAALILAHAAGCNPGGEVRAYALGNLDDPRFGDHQRDLLARTPFNTLLSVAELDALGWEPRQQGGGDARRN